MKKTKKNLDVYDADKQIFIGSFSKDTLNDMIIPYFILRGYSYECNDDSYVSFFKNKANEF